MRLLAATCALLAGPLLVGVTTARAEGDGAPSILLLESGVKKLEATFSAVGEARLETLSGKLASFPGGEMKLKGCQPIEGSEERDTSLCKDVPIKFSGGKCRTEGSEAGVISFSLDLHVAAERNANDELVPILLAKSSAEN